MKKYKTMRVYAEDYKKIAKQAKSHKIPITYFIHNLVEWSDFF